MVSLSVLLLMWTCGKNRCGTSARIFPQIHISVLLVTTFSFGDVPKAMAHFSLYGREALAKKSFSVAGKIRGSDG